MVDDYKNVPHITTESLLRVTQILAIFCKLFLKSVAVYFQSLSGSFYTDINIQSS